MEPNSTTQTFFPEKTYKLHKSTDGLFLTWQKEKELLAVMGMSF